MAKRRMFSTDIIDTDSFLDMPSSSKCLYYDLGMRADDDGFVSPKKVVRLTGASEDDLKVLIAKNFIIPFKSGVIVIKDWKMNNYIQKDRYTETIYKEEKKLLSENELGSYILESESNVQLEETQPLTPARVKRIEAKKNSDLPYSFEYKIRSAFNGATCPVCKKIMNSTAHLTKPTIQHNVPISKGGKHELNNISVICRSCNLSIQANIIPQSNTDLVIEAWKSIGNGSGLDTQDRLGKDRLGKVSKEKYSSLKDIKDIDIEELAEQYHTSVGFVKLKLETLKNYCESKGKTYKNYKSALRNFVLGDMQREIQRPKKGMVLDATNL